jgi:uncharacterized delta-60 repeat protein
MDGTLDKTYGTNGGWTPGTFDTTQKFAFSQVLDSAGRTVIVGYTESNIVAELFVARYTADGILDTTFGTNGSGYTTTQFYTGEPSYGYSLILDSSDRILFVGYSWNTNDTDDQKLILARYTANGILDPTFGSNGGWTPTQFYTNRGARGYSLILDSSDRIIVTGSSSNAANTNNQLVVARYTANGILDPTFGTGGFTDTAFYPGQSEGGYQLVLDSTERIIINGYTRNITSDFTQLVVARYTANGILDPTFGSNGGFTPTTFYTGESSDTSTNSLVLDSTEQIILVGTTQDSTSGLYKLLVVRYTTNGILDPTFGSSSGWTLTPISPRISDDGYSLVLDSTGRILVTTNTLDTQSGRYELIVARYSANGILDPTFGSNDGFTTTTFYPGNNESGVSLVLDSTGKIIILGFTLNLTSNLILTRYTASGILDTTYGTNGGWTLGTFGTVIDLLSFGFGIVIDSEGRTIVTGSVTYISVTGINVSGVLIARYTKGGILDTTFGTNGRGWTATEFVPGVPQAGNSLVLDSKGRIIVTGYVGDTEQLLVARYTADGILDTTFGSSNGWTPINSNRYTGIFVVLDSTDRIIISASRDNIDAYASEYVLLYRFTADGILDNMFGTNGSTTTTFYPGKKTSGYSLKLDSTNRIIVCGYTQSSTSINLLLLIARYSVDGILDTTFGTSGGFTTTEVFPGKPSFGRSLVLDSTDRIIVTGTTVDSEGFYLRSVFARYTKNGILDTTFGTSGGFTISTFNPGFETYQNKILLDKNGMIITCASVIDLEGSRTQLLVAKYTSDGLVDTTFGTSGIGWTGTTFIPGKDSYGTCLVLDSDGRIIVTGFTNRPNSLVPADNQLIVARYLNHVDTTTTTEPICLPAGTPILTDQGTFPIEQLDPKKHTINHKSIVAITKTITPEKHLICFEANSVGINFPTKRTLMTPGHEVLYKGKLVQAKHFVGRLGGVHTVPYNGTDVLYNVLQRQHGLMVVNNMVVETLHPENKVAREILEKL